MFKLGFVQYGGAPPTPLGPFGLFSPVSQSGGLLFDKYYYSTNTAIPSISAGDNNSLLYYSAVGDKVNGIFSNWRDTYKYTYANDTIVNFQSNSDYYAGGVSVACTSGNTSYGLFASGRGYRSQVSLYQYSTDTVLEFVAEMFSVPAPGNSYTPPANRDWGAAVGNASLAIIAGGAGSQEILRTSNSFLYADYSCYPHTDLSGPRQNMIAAGNTSVGYIFGGSTKRNYGEGGYSLSDLVSITDKYTYSNASMVNKTNLSHARADHCATGNSSMAIINGGYGDVSGTLAPVSTNEVYNYSNDTVVSMGDVMLPRTRQEACSSVANGM